MRRSIIIFILATATLALQPAGVLTQSAGQWSAVMDWPYRAIHAALLPTNNVLFWNSTKRPTTLSSGIGPPTRSALPLTPVTTSSALVWRHGRRKTVPRRRTHRRQCRPRLHIHIRSSVEFVDSPPNMNAGRWYPSVTNLPNGDVLVLGGVQDTTVGMNVLPQVFQSRTGTYRDLTNAQLWLPFYPFTFVAPDGRVFVAGPTKTTRYLDTSGSGAWSVVGDTPFGVTGTWYGSRQWGSAVMYQPGKVLLAGGSQCPRTRARAAASPQPPR